LHRPSESTTANELINNFRQTSNGGVLAAMVAAGAGCAAMGFCYTLATASAGIARCLIWYAPAGGLSGMSGVAVLVWLAVWFALHWKWSQCNLPPRRIVFTALALFALGVLLTFPPLARIF
jgi:hypothetical protein